MGVPVSITGSLQAVFLLAVVLVKPIFAALADAFPSYRRLIFLMTVAIMSLSLCSIYFIPPMREDLRLEGQLVRAVEKSSDEEVLINRVFVEPGPSYEERQKEDDRGEIVLRTPYEGKT